MRVSLHDIAGRVAAAVARQGHADIAAVAGENCAWLHGAGYNGIKYLAEALSDDVRQVVLEKDLMGLDLQGVSCVYLFPQIETLYGEHGRMFLRNVRHGLFLLRASVEGNYGIGCPVDPGFALGGERTKNPYAEKLELAAREGVDVDDALWQSLAG
jgi:hypothetical protein